MSVETRQHRSADKKRNLLDAAERVYYRDGDLGMTVRRLATEASTTSQTIYTYFGSRDAVIAGMYERVLSELDRLLGSIDEASQTPAPQPVGLLRLVGLYRRHAVANPAHLRMLATARGPEGTNAVEIVKRRDRLIDLLDRCGPFPATAHGGGADVVVAAVNGFVEAELNQLFAADSRPDDLFADLVRGLVTTT